MEVEKREKGGIRIWGSGERRMWMGEVRRRKDIGIGKGGERDIRMCKFGERDVVVATGKMWWWETGR